MRPVLALAVCAALGCGTYFPVNRPLERRDPASGYRAALVSPPHQSEQLSLALALSGGGTRAAAFAYGVLEELAATEIAFDGARRSLIDEVDAISGVSGGSFPAAYLGLRGRRIFEDFEERFLRRDVQGALLLRLLWPINWLKLFSPYWARSDLAADYYDAKIFDHATFADLARSGGPFVSIHATDLVTGSPFAFTQEQFDYLCSDLSSYPVSRAVAASSAVPIVLSPITLRNYGGCDFPAPAWVTDSRSETRQLDRAYVNGRNLLTYLDQHRRYVRLVDGVISDNLGVRGPFEAWVQRENQGPSRAAANPVRRVVLLIVNAQTTPDVEWEQVDVLPSLSFILDAATSAQVNRYNFETLELLQRTFDLWNQATEQWNPPLRFELIEVSFLDVEDEVERRRLNRLATSFSLSDDAIDRLRAAARQGLKSNERFQALRRDLAALPAEPATAVDPPAPPVP